MHSLTLYVITYILSIMYLLLSSFLFNISFFSYTVVRAYSMFYANLNAADYKVTVS